MRNREVLCRSIFGETYPYKMVDGKKVWEFKRSGRKQSEQTKGNISGDIFSRVPDEQHDNGAHCCKQSCNT